jgi:uncharacterized protein YjiS (DUF1127 family)
MLCRGVGEDVPCVPCRRTEHQPHQGSQPWNKLFTTKGCTTAQAAEWRPAEDARRGYGGTPRVVRTVLEWNQRIRQRQALAELDDHLLSDIGISRTAAAIEASRPFWR